MVTSASPSRATVSFEFFPPKTEAMEAQLWRAVTDLAGLHPSFVSVTYGAGGSTRERTHETVARIRRDTDLEPAAHLTCVAASRDEVDAVAKAYWADGIRHIVALRGDPPEGVGERYTPHPEGYPYAVDLIHGLKRLHDFEISVAAYPEGHPEATSPEVDLDNLKRKQDAGATRAISQYFFDIDAYRRFMDRVAAAGITLPISPGILPVANFATVCKFSQACGTRVPDWMHARFAGLDDDPQARARAAVEVACNLGRALLADGAGHIHFYTLNRADLTTTICQALGLTPDEG
ncbi:methylenetetrahydrofolate reductase [NAD(P)H] [Roseospirillum parvum]|uniref:Methylenetetrahydrofolate reductase n=1 Tax=Roseospirillum parvum TaxID=83401 RepID=A0A1G8C291_9PROT|nr:methylenetetrahydrofolate reductase [NAD(P)H] [Roseospirillum parvum]SDH39473.1 methylenetetrahydrofolate reductase (NADPH) [Roseospirillum parvum]